MRNLSLALTIDPRLALMVYAAMLLTATGPIVAAWLALLPREREPFARPGEARTAKPRDGFAIFLLANISVSLLLRIPGVENRLRSLNVTRSVFRDNADQALMCVFLWFGFVPGLAAAYAAVRANPIRIPLITGGLLVLALWLAGPWLLGQIVGSS